RRGMRQREAEKRQRLRCFWSSALWSPDCSVARGFGNGVTHDKLTHLARACGPRIGAYSVLLERGDERAKRRQDDVTQRNRFGCECGRTVEGHELGSGDTLIAQVKCHRVWMRAHVQRDK